MVHTTHYRLRQPTGRHLVVGVAFGLAMAGAICLGLLTKQLTRAATTRDCSTNSIDNKSLNGGCGALTPAELIADLRDNNPSDMQTLFADPSIGLTPAKFDRFASTARMGEVRRDGAVIVDGQTVMTGVHTVGRERFNEEREPVVIGGTTYFHGPPSVSFADGVESLPVMVMFDSDGTPEVAVLTPCGNPVVGEKVKPVFACKALHAKPVDSTTDTFDFSTQVSAGKGASVSQLIYDFGDGSATVITTNPAETIRHQFATSGTFTVKVTSVFKLPGDQEKTLQEPMCTTPVSVAKAPPPPTVTVPQLPKAGMGGALGILAGTSTVAAAAHYTYVNRRSRRR